MDTVKTLVFIILFIPSLALASVAGNEANDIQSWLNLSQQYFYKPGSGDQWIRNSLPNGDRFIYVPSGFNYRGRYNDRMYPVKVEKVGEIDGSKIGKAVAKCELSAICKDVEH